MIEPSTAVPRPIAAAIAVVIREDRVLLVRRANPSDAGLWGFPGGKIDFGETIQAAAIRELHEETGVEGAFDGSVAKSADGCSVPFSLAVQAV